MLNSNNAMNILPENSEKRKDFTTIKRDFETAYASGKDYAPELMDLSTAIAYSVVAKCIDPQRKTAGQQDSVSKTGFDPTMVSLRQGIAADIATLENTRRNAEKAAKTTFDSNGELVTIVADKDAETAISKLVSSNLSDGINLVQTAALALLEQAIDHADGENWLDTPYNVRRLSKRVYIKATDSAAYRDETTTPIQEAFREVRRHIMNSRAVRTDPRNGYTYIEDYTQDGLDAIYLRMGKYADMGGYDCNGNYTADIQTAHTYENILEKLNLTARQSTIISLRMQGMGYKAIATYLGVTHEAVRKQLVRIGERAAAIGFMPDGYTPKTKEHKPKPAKEQKPQEPKNPPEPPKPVAQIDDNGKEIAVYKSIRAASDETGIDRRGIYHAIRGIKQKKAGGYYWKLAE